MNSAPQPIRKRRRPPKACEQCRKRKVRCDLTAPCSQCTRLNLDCTYDPQTISQRVAKRPKTKASSAASGAPPTPTSTIIDHDSQLNHQSNSSIVQSTFTTPVAPSAPLEPYHISEELLEDRPLHVNGPGIPGWQPPDIVSSKGTRDLHGAVTKTRLLGRSHWLNIIQEFHFVLRLQESIESGHNGHAKALLDKCKILGRKIKSRIHSELKSGPVGNLRDAVPPKIESDSLVDNYFRAFESCYRILHVPSFRREYEQFWKTPESASHLFLLKLLLILAIGTTVTDQVPNHQLHLSSLKWIDAAHSWSTSPYTEKARVSVSGIQIQCLLLLARETCSVSPDLIWISAGSLLRTAMLTGLHRDPSCFHRMTASQAEIRRRLWATVMEMCLQSSMNAGGSPLISSDMHDCQSPSNLDDDDLDSGTGSINSPRDDKVLTQSSFQIALTKTLPIRIRVASILNDFRVEQSYAETLQIGTKLTECLHQSTSKLKSDYANRSKVGSETHLQMYQIMTYRFLIGLHQTFAIKAMSDPMYYFSRKSCLDTCLLISSTAFPIPNQTIPALRGTSDFDKILEVSCGTPKNVITLAFLMISLELVNQLQTAHSPPSNIAESLVRQEIFRVLEAYSQLTFQRVKRGETNVKGYAFSACGLGYLKALIAGQPAEEAALKDAIDATQASFEILQKRYDESTSVPALTPLDDSVFENDFNALFGDDFGWDEWDPDFNLDVATEFFFPLS